MKRILMLLFIPLIFLLSSNNIKENEFNYIILNEEYNNFIKDNTLNIYQFTKKFIGNRDDLINIKYISFDDDYFCINLLIKNGYLNKISLCYLDNVYIEYEVIIYNQFQCEYKLNKNEKLLFNKSMKIKEIEIDLNNNFIDEYNDYIGDKLFKSYYLIENDYLNVIDINKFDDLDNIIYSRYFDSFISERIIYSDFINKSGKYNIKIERITADNILYLDNYNIILFDDNIIKINDVDVSYNDNLNEEIINRFIICDYDYIILDYDSNYEKELGSYSGTINIKVLDKINKTINFNINVIDDIKPILSKKGNIITNINKRFNENEIKNYIYYIDKTNCRYEYIDIDDYKNNYNKPGNYNYDVKVIDEYNNEETINIKIEVLDVINEEDDLISSSFDFNKIYTRKEIIEKLVNYNYFNKGDDVYLESDYFKANKNGTYLLKATNKMDTYYFNINYSYEDSNDNNYLHIIIIVFSIILLSIITIIIVKRIKKNKIKL